MDKATEERLLTLVAARDKAHSEYEERCRDLAKVLASRPAPMAEMARELGISRQALYEFEARWSA